jgi:hypothetical protein
MRIRTVENVYKERIKKLEEEKEIMKNEIINSTLKLISKYSDKYEIKGGHAVYKKDIIVNKVKYRNKIYFLPKEMIGKYYIKGLAIPLKSIVEMVICREAYHPNVDNNNVVCLGDMAGRNVEEVLDKLPEILETANLDSCYSNSASSELKKYAITLEESKEGKGVWNSNDRE